MLAAGSGTLMLDEIGELPLSMQAKLLRAVQERELTPLGSTRPRPLSARLVCATNRTLLTEVEAGRFREDLYYRLAVVVIELPPLRERLDDIPNLARHLLTRLASAQGRDEPELTAAAARKLLSFDYPGNVRQLENLLSQALVFCANDRIEPEDLVLPEMPRRRRGHREFEAAEAAEIAAALEATRWNVAEVSRRLGIPRTSLYRKLKRYGLDRGGRR